MKKQKVFQSTRMKLSVAGILFLGTVLLFTNGVVAGEKPDIIRVSAIADLTGPYAAGMGGLAPGFEDAWKYINTELGGVRGVKVELVIRDMAGKMPLALTMYNELINMNPKPLFVLLGNSAFGAAVRERLKEDDIIGYVAPATDCVYPVGNSYAIHPFYPDMMAANVKYIKDNWKQQRNPKMGIIVWDTAYGRGILTDEFFAYLKSIGVDIVGTETFGVRELDVKSQLLRLRAKDPDYLIIHTAVGGTIAIKKSCKEIGWEIKTINSIGTEWATVRAVPQLFDGDICQFNVKSFDEVDDPSIKTIMKHFNKNGRTINEVALYYLMAWVGASIQHAAMVNVVDKYGWGGFNTRNCLEAVLNLRNFMPLGGLSNVNYSEKRPTEAKSRIYNVKNGKILPLTADFVELPDLRPAKYK